MGVWHAERPSKSPKKEEVNVIHMTLVNVAVLRVIQGAITSTDTIEQTFAVGRHWVLIGFSDIIYLATCFILVT